MEMTQSNNTTVTVSWTDLKQLLHVQESGPLKGVKFNPKKGLIIFIIQTGEEKPYTGLKVI